jgi:protease stability complex PrcB-like protein
MKVLVCALLLASCSSPNAPDATQPLAVTRLRPEAFSFSYNSGMTEPQRLVVRDQATWQQTWDSIHRFTFPVPALPAVDFSRDMVIVAALGQKPTGGFSIFVDGAMETARGVTVNVRSVSPGASCGVTAALTQPLDIARVTRRDGAVSFSESTTVQSCN